MDFWIPRQFIVHDQLKGFDIQTARSDIGRDQDAGAAVGETDQRLIAIALFQIAMQRQCALPGSIQGITDRLAIFFGIAEHHAGGRLMLAQQFLQERDFPLLRGFKELLLYGGQRIYAVDFNGQGIFLHAPADGGDGFRPGCREQQRLAIGRCETDHFVNRVAEAHIQHPICLIHHQCV